MEYFQIKLKPAGKTISNNIFTSHNLLERFSFKARRIILPVLVFGITSTKNTPPRSFLYGLTLPM